MLLSLLTDFGPGSSYVAQMKARLLEERPALSLVDISHDCPPQDLRAAAWLLYSFVQGLPRRRRLHLCVVDPGVGSERALVWLRALGQDFLAPDNGLLSYVLALDPQARSRLLPSAPVTGSATFHGRDHFVPLALRLLAGEDPGGVEGKARCPYRLEPESEGEALKGRILFVDDFGNCISALREEHAGHAGGRFVYGDREMPLRRCYAECREGEASVILGSAGHYEIALKDGSAAELVGREEELVLLPRE